MSNISGYLENIMNARFGKDVRSSIHDAINEMNVEITEAEDSALKSAQSAEDSLNRCRELENYTTQLYFGTQSNAKSAYNSAQSASESLSAVSEKVLEMNRVESNVTRMRTDVSDMKSEVSDMQSKVAADKEEIDKTIKSSLLASSEEILNSVKSYFERAEQLYNSIYIDCDGENAKMRATTLVEIDCGNARQRVSDNGIFFDGGNAMSRLLGQ